MKLHNMPAPADLKEYILKNTYKNFIVELKKNKGYYCTREMKEVEPDFDKYDIQHNQVITVYCDGCERGYCETKYKKEMYSGKYEAIRGQILWFVKKGKTTFAQLSQYVISYGKGMRPEIIAWGDIAQYKLNKDEQKAAKKEYSYATGEYEYVERKAITIPSFKNMGYSTIDEFLIYEKDGNIALGTDLKYANVENWRDEHIIRYLDQFLKYPAIEILEKAGFLAILAERIKLGKGCRKINWKKRRLQDILKMNRKDLKEAKWMNMFALEMYWKLKGIFPEATPEWQAIIRFNTYGRIEYKEKLLEINSMIKFKRLIDYMKDQIGRIGNMEILDYMDYIKDLKTCGELTKKNLKPADFYKAHIEYADKASKLMDEKAFELFKSAVEVMGENLSYEQDGLLIRPAESAKELINESDQLKHCVKTYVKDVTKGNKMIFFIRKKEEEEKPYFTLEMRPTTGEIVQCRGERNCNYGEDIETFLEEWKKVVVKEMKRREKCKRQIA